jgi:hypothetical protein
LQGELEGSGEYLRSFTFSFLAIGRSLSSAANMLKRKTFEVFKPIAVLPLLMKVNENQCECSIFKEL